MARAHTRYVCQTCGESQPKWAGKCPACGTWGSLVEEAQEAAPRGLGPIGKGSGEKTRGTSIALEPLEGKSETPPRRPTGVGELDRPLGGGFVTGGVILLGGDPGIGKSTLLLQTVARMARKGARAVYVCGEESTDQVRLRAERLGVDKSPLHLAATTSVRDLLTTLGDSGAPDLLVIDSIQTMFVDTLDSAPGTVAQVRTSAQEIIRYAKRAGVAVILVGHVTKDGQIAGPRVLEHMVDTVLYFEGDRTQNYRLLRSVKNRFGGTDEIGVFDMTGRGLIEVANPSALFLSERSDAVTGTSVFAGVEGSRAMLIEIQALVAPTAATNPRRNVVGWDSGRLAMIIAVLDARCNLGLAFCDVYLNIAGGLRIREPAADLAVAAALVSSKLDCALPLDKVVFGEIALSGEVRSTTQTAARLREAEKLGFRGALLPNASKKLESTLDLGHCATVKDLVELIDAVK